jgi:hypothetical protein
VMMTSSIRPPLTWSNTHLNEEHPSKKQSWSRLEATCIINDYSMMKIEARGKDFIVVLMNFGIRPPLTW